MRDGDWKWLEIFLCLVFILSGILTLSVGAHLTGLAPFDATLKFLFGVFLMGIGVAVIFGAISLMSKVDD